MSSTALSSSNPLRRTFSSYLVTPSELNDALKKNSPTKISTSPRTIPLCATWFMPNDPQKRTGLAAFTQKRIPTARFFDLDEIKDKDSQYPHMLPTSDVFAEAMRDLGIRRDDVVVVYDSEEAGLFSAPRVGWTLRVFGHPHVHILNNFKVWCEEGYPTESGPTTSSPIGAPESKSDYGTPSLAPDMVVKFVEMKEIAKDYGKEGAEEVQILDARPHGRWAGTAPEPRPGLPSGHIPGSTSLGFSRLLDPKTKTLLPKEELKKIFEEMGLNEEKPIISSCGTGVTAAIIETALKEADFGREEDRRLYDGSWT